MEEFIRLIALIGEENYKKLKKSKIAIIGLGGVGGYVAEGLARSGVESFVLVDDDVVKESNLNRQIIALHSSLGKPKTDLWKERIKDINPLAVVDARNERYTEENVIDFSDCDYVIDAIDSMNCKAKLLTECFRANIPVISCMGTGAKFDPDYVVTDIYSTKYDPIAKKLRKLLRANGVERLKVVYAEDNVKKLCLDESGKYVPSTIVYSPCFAGMVIVREVIKDIIFERCPKEQKE